MQIKSIRNWVFEAARLFSARNRVLQIGALAYRVRNDTLEVCLITSRGGGRWIIPKGWPEPDLSHAEAAGKEAWEEAGLTGEVDPETYASYPTFKTVESGVELAVRMDVYLLPNPTQAKKFPELGQRMVKWLEIEEAARRVDEDGLRDVLNKLSKTVATGHQPYQ